MQIRMRVSLEARTKSGGSGKMYLQKPLVELRVWLVFGFTCSFSTPIEVAPPVR